MILNVLALVDPDLFHGNVAELVRALLDRAEVLERYARMGPPDEEPAIRELLREELGALAVELAEEAVRDTVAGRAFSARSDGDWCARAWTRAQKGGGT